jgi:hypothetical protein
MMARVRMPVARTEAPGRMPSAAELLRAIPSRETLRPFAVWVLIIAVGIALLYGRFDWDTQDGLFAERGFWLSSFMLAIFLPTSFYVSRRVLRSTRAAVVITAIFFVITTLPYEWLDLDGLYYYLERHRTFPIDELRFGGDPTRADPRIASLEFFPEGALRQFPGDYIFWPLLFAAGAGVIWGIWWFRNRAQPVARRLPLLLTAAFALICIQAAVHTGMRAPYTYLAHFQLPESEQHWYHAYHFYDGSGATEADQHAFFAIEDYFHGGNYNDLNMLLRRPLPYYLAAQGSFFVNTMYVWLALNCLFWLLAVVATAKLVERLATPRAGLIAGALTVVGPGFVAFVATSGMYMQYYTAVVVALWAFEEWVVPNRGRDLGSVALFAAVLSLCALVYDFAPVLLVLLLYGAARKVRPAPLVGSLVAAAAVPFAFTLVATELADITISTANTDQVDQAISGFKDEVLPPSLSGWYDHTADVVPSFVRQLLQAFFVIPAVIAVFGLRKLRDRPQQVLVGAFFAVIFGVVALFEIGGVPNLEHLPRLVYPLFPVVYLLCALVLDPGAPRPSASELREMRPRERIPLALRHAAPWIVVAAMFVLVNVDIFGFPTMYVEFFVGDPPKFLP